MLFSRLICKPASASVKFNFRGSTGDDAVISCVSACCEDSRWVQDTALDHEPRFASSGFSRVSFDISLDFPTWHEEEYKSIYRQ